jgi:peptide deformylase
MKIVKYPHPALRHPVKPLTAIDKQVHLQVGEMLELMYASRGLGLAANQVVLPYQVFIANPTADPEQRDHELVCINPVILERKGTVEADEGCLSFPELYQKVRRARMVKMQAYNLKGEAFEVTSSELAARVLQHELDHLHGVLFIDKMGFWAKRASKDALESLEREFRRAQERGEIPPDAELAAALESEPVSPAPSANPM